MNENITLTLTREQALCILNDLIQFSDEFTNWDTEDDTNVQVFMTATGLTYQDYMEWL